MTLDCKTRIRFNDYSNYDSDKCRNGGCYGFWTQYDLVGNSIFEVSHGTTADMDFCPVCGSFNDHYEGDDSVYESGYSCGDFEKITADELIKLIDNFEETEEKYITYYGIAEGD